MASLEWQLEENEGYLKDIVSDISRQLEENARCLQDSVNHISRLSRQLEVFEKVKEKVKGQQPDSSVKEQHQLSAIFDDLNEAAQPEPKLDSAFFTSDGLLDPEELFALNKGFQKTPLAQKDGKRYSISDDVKEEVQPEPKRPSFLRKSLAWDSAFFTSDGLLDPVELLAVNKGFKKTPLAQKDGKRSKLATKIGGSQTNTLSQDSKRTNAFTTPINKNIDCSYESYSSTSSQNLSKSKVDPKGVKLSSSPSSVLYFPLSSSPASSDDGWLSESLCSTTITHQSPIQVLDFHSQNSKEKKFTSQNVTIKSSRLRMPSPRIGFFDMKQGSMQDHFHLVQVKSKRIS
ncbi:hypothetical protein SSX86_003476 [Deinandra increscens subsp. villosa]|uniref:Uncharacterized protein n=1 Tax=Deinandra increscens subsp. villosa TaxID=3103831 RepID=A0AAP0DID9_9ASTR